MEIGNNLKYPPADKNNFHPPDGIVKENKVKRENTQKTK